MELLGLLLASAGASLGLWAWQRRREQRFALTAGDFEAALAPDAAVALSVARHECESRAHPGLWPIHLLYGLLQDEVFTAAIAKLDGDATAIESRVVDELDKRTKDPDVDALRDTARVLGYAYGNAYSSKRQVTCTDVWAYLCRTETAKLLGVDSLALLFVLVHGMPAPAIDWTDRVDVHVVLRNDDYTTRDFVEHVLRDVFALPEAEAHTRMMQAHESGHAIVGRYKIAVARDKIATVRARAVEQRFPLWIGLEDC